MIPAEHFTKQFYNWESRCRGWHLAEAPIHLEPSYIPFFYHGHQDSYIDDGKRPTIVSSFFDLFKTKKELEPLSSNLIDYEKIEMYEYIPGGPLEALQVRLPKDRKVTPEKMKAILIMLSYSREIISFEIIGKGPDIIIQFVAEDSVTDSIKTNIEAYFPECTIAKDDSLLHGLLRPDYDAATVDFGLGDEVYRLLEIPKDYKVDPLSTICSILENLKNDSVAGIQILFQGNVNNWGESIRESVTFPDGTSFFENEPLAPEFALQKVQSPMFSVTIRAFAQARERQYTLKTVEALGHAIINSSQSAINHLIALQDKAYDFERRILDVYYRRSHRTGMLLNVDELSCLLHFPSEHIVSKKLFRVSRKTVEIPSIMSNKAYVLGTNYHAGVTEQVTFGLEDRLKHTHIIGATGTGKSTLVANLILQDIAKKSGVVLFDPHGDLVDDVISRIPTERLEDVVLIDPSDAEYSVGLNILQAHSEIEKEVLSSDLVASFRKHATSWGDQMNSVLGNAILAILEHPEGGSLQDLRRFLLESVFRAKYLQNITDPHILYYWQREYPLLKTNSIGSILTRLDTFLRPKSIRNMVVQKKGLDFGELINSNKIILFKLSQGLIGAENSFLLGSLLLSKIHQAILQRQQSYKRSPVMLYLDEFQNFITPSIKEMFSGVRKYSVGLTVSHQDLQQLQREDGELFNSVLGNISNRIVFRVGEPDAKKLQDSFTNFTYIDLQNLGRGQAIVRIEQPQYDSSLETYPLPRISEKEKIGKIERVTQHSRETYAKRKQYIEQEFTGISHQKIQIIRDEIAKEKPPVRKEVPVIVEPAIAQTPENEEANQSVHRYLQTLIKKMAEQCGFIAGIETQLPDGSGQVDVLLTKDRKTIAVEICNTTDADWEMHNIQKCLNAHYDMVVSVSGDPKQLEKIKRKCEQGIPDISTHNIKFFTPDALFACLDSFVVKETHPKENIMKGYRVNVSYDSMTSEDMERKRASIAKVMLNSLNK